jgi:CheY-like chemotaxis protein
MRVLIVDDEESMRALLSALLADRGYEVVAALESGDGITAAIREKNPEIICLDYQLPGRDGLDVLREIHEANPLIDVLFMTASDDAAVERSAADAGAAGFIRKPFGQAQIIKEVEVVWEARQQATAAHAKLATTDTEAAEAPARKPFNPRSVVIADDNGSIRFLLKGLLSELGFSVVHLVANGKDAVEAAKTYRPGVLCLDVEMPGMSGLDALPLIREASPQTAVVMVTGSATRELVERAGAGGAKGYIVKPIRPAHLQAFMSKLVK